MEQKKTVLEAEIWRIAESDFWGKYLKKIPNCERIIKELNELESYLNSWIEFYPDEKSEIMGPLEVVWESFKQ